MLAGRVAADVVNIAVGVGEVAGGIALGTAGAAVSCVATLCTAAVVTVGAGAVAVGAGATTALAGAAGFGGNFAQLTGSSGSSFTAHNFAKNLEARSPKPTILKNPEAHHMLPQALESRFNQLRINIHDPQWGAWVEGTPPGTHQNWTAAYQKEWTTWLNNNPNAHITDVNKQAAYMAKNYGIIWP